MPTQIKVCMPLFLPADQLALARDLAIAENPQNVPRPTEIAGIPGKFWRPGRTLRCAFLDGDAGVQAKVAAVAHQWSVFANIFFDFGAHAEADIRISFAFNGSWSYIGTDALAIPTPQPTMNYGWLTPQSSDTEYNRVVLHEFGHALGMIHEHQHPEAGFTWDRDAVIAYYGGPPNDWPVSKIEHNVLNRYDRTTTQYSAFDVHSIMLYPIPEEHTLGDFSVDWRNAELSDTDRAFISRVYPTDVLPFDASVLAPNNKLYIFRGAEYIRVTPGAGVDAGYPKTIAENWGNWPEAFASGIDAVMRYTDNKLYFFKGSQYLRYTPGVGVDDGFPKSIAEGWPFIRF
ncbi:MAG: hemopexin repeat-containing protein [Anaerolineae bacterium]|nr:hemopexin repeat-containing protein [Anaerolineae bacterium]